MTKIIVACDENNLIGDGNKLPWNLPEDLKHFKETTQDSVVIMGKNTWDSLPRKPLPKRINCIISRTKTYDSFSLYNLDIEWYATIKDAIRYNKHFYKDKPIFIIGGQKIYESALNDNLVDEIIMTKIKRSFKGDKFFPKLDPKVWHIDSIIKETSEYKIVKYKKELI
jgi:dihydrofolate reductase